MSGCVIGCIRVSHRVFVLLHLAVLGNISQWGETRGIAQHSIAIDVGCDGGLSAPIRVRKVLATERPRDGEVRWSLSSGQALSLDVGGRVGRVEGVNLVNVVGSGQGEWLGLVVVLSLRQLSRKLFLQPPTTQRPLRSLC